MKHNENIENIEFPDQKIVGVEMEHEVKSSFIAYSMSVIMSRALPDVRDGLKPVHRRILYSMYEDKLTYNNDFRKSATTVGNVLGRYHPHGDTAVYDTMVRLAQPFSMRHPLVQGQGNFGSIDGDKAAAYRYTESRLSKLSNEMMRDIEKDVVDFTPNFDNTRSEPSVLPARFPNLLVNGSIGIAVGMATYVPPHNLGEVIDGTVYYMDHPDCEITELMQFIKGPDFPTAATVYGSNGIYQAYTTGRGHVMVRAKCEVDEEHHKIIVTELPYQVNKKMLVEAIADLVKSKRIEGIKEIIDLSDRRRDVHIEIVYRQDVNGQVILNQLYKYSQLQDTCAFNMLALVNNVPKVLNLKQILSHYVAHQEEVITRRTAFDLEKAKREAHILEGYKIVIDNIDEVIKIIRASASISDAKERLIERFGFTDVQAQAIVEMTLGRLSGMERQKIEERLDVLHATIEELTGILADPAKVRQIIKDEMLEIKEKFATPRLTELVEAEDEIVLEDLIERHTAVITLTHGGYIKRQPSDTYTAQRRGGKGIIGMTTKEEDFVEKVIAVDSHSFVLMFTNLGRVYIKKAYQIPEAGRTAKGTNVVNVLELQDGEKVTSMLSVAGFAPDEYLLMVTKLGTIKRTSILEFENCRRGGKIAVELSEGDELVFVRHTTGVDQIMIASHEGNAVRFDENDARVMGRTARGVRGIRLEEGDYVVGATLVEEDKKLITVTENGYGKRSDFADFTVHNRGGKGVTCHNLTEKTGLLSGIAAVDEDDDIMIITNEGTIIRTAVNEIPVYNRTAGGVIVMRLSEDAKIVNFAKVATDAEEETPTGDAGADTNAAEAAIEPMIDGPKGDEE